MKNRRQLKKSTSARRSVRGLLFLFPLMLAAPSQPGMASEGQEKWITLGTAGGPVAVPNRSQPSNLLLTKDQAILVDVGDGTVGQLAKSGIPINRVSTIFLSHLHYDHIGGISALLGLRVQIQDTRPLAIYGPPGTRRMINGLIAAMRPSAETGLGTPGEKIVDPAQTVSVIELEGGETVPLGDVSIRSVPNTHYSYPSGSADDRQFRSLSYRFDTPVRSIVFTGDTGPSASVTQLAHGADILVTEIIDVDATLAGMKASMAIPDQVAQGIGFHFRHHHLTAEEVGKMAEEAGVKKVVLTHLAPPNADRRVIQRMRQKIRTYYSSQIVFAVDGMTF